MLYTRHVIHHFRVGCDTENLYGQREIGRLALFTYALTDNLSPQ